MQRVRRAILAGFVLLYLVLCPFTILYSLGYVLKPGFEHGIVKTGLISLATTPANASIYIGNRRYTKRTPAILRDLLPGQYQIKLLLKGYRPWVATLSVAEERATVLEHILLLPEQWKPTLLLGGPFENLLAVPESPYLLLMKGSQLGHADLYHMKAEKSWSLLAGASPLQEANVLSVATAREAPILLLYVGSKEGEQWVWVEPRGRENHLERLGGFSAKVQWEASDKDRLFTLQDGTLDRVDLGAKTLVTSVLDHVQGYGVFRRSLYVVKGNTFQRCDLDGKNPETLLDDPALGRTLFGGKGSFRIHVLAKDMVLFLGERGELLCNRLPYRLVDQGVLGLAYDVQQERVLLWRNDRLGVLEFPRSASSERVFELGPKLRWVYEQGKNISQAFWVSEGSHILFHDQDRLMLLEAGSIESPQVSEIMQVKKNSAVAYMEDAGKAYYLDPTSGALNSIEMIPRHELLPLSFPNRVEERQRRGVAAP